MALEKVFECPRTLTRLRGGPLGKLVEGFMIDKAGAPPIGKKAPWQQPHVLQWLNKLAKGRELCAVNC